MITYVCFMVQQLNAVVLKLLNSKYERKIIIGYRIGCHIYISHVAITLNVYLKRGKV